MAKPFRERHYVNFIFDGQENLLVIEKDKQGIKLCSLKKINGNRKSLQKTYNN